MILACAIKKQLRNFRLLIFRLKRKTQHKIKDWYVSNFQICRKCRKRIEPKEGYWHYKNKYPLIGDIIILYVVQSIIQLQQDAILER